MGRPGKLAQVRVVQLEGIDIVAQIAGVLPGTVPVAVPEQPLDPFQCAQQAFALVGIVVGDAAGILLQRNCSTRCGCGVAL